MPKNTPVKKEPEKKPVKKEPVKKPEEKPEKKLEKKSEEKPKEIQKKKSVNKGDAPNKDTARAELYFNVKFAKKWLKNYYSRYTLTVKVRDVVDDLKKKNTETKETKETRETNIRLNDAHFALGVIDECLCSKLSSTTLKKSKKNTVGLYTITEENIMDSIRLNKDLNYTFGRFLDEYDTHSNYGSELFLEKKTVHKFLEKYGFDGGNVGVQLESGAFNLLLFCMLKNRILLAESAYHKILFAGKQSVNLKAIFHSLPDVYSGELLKLMIKKVENIISKLKDTKSLDDESDKKSEKKDTKSKSEYEDEDEDEEEDTKSESEKEDSDDE